MWCRCNGFNVGARRAGCGVEVHEGFKVGCGGA